MPAGGFTPAQWLVLVEHELLLFAGLFFLLGALDELAVDLIWVWLRLTGRGKSEQLAAEEEQLPLSGRAAVFIPAWREEAVIEATVRHALGAWPQANMRLFVGCYSNDFGTARAARAGAEGDARLRVVIQSRPGPTTKADCLNRLYSAMQDEERSSGVDFRMVVLHDAEDMVDPAALSLMDRHIGAADLVQLPVLPHPMPQSRWIASHYTKHPHNQALIAA